MLILLVEDNPGLASNIIDFLSMGQLEVDCATSAHQANKLIFQQNYDVVILDLNLPDGDGIELCQSWRRAYIHTPIIMLTARGELEDRLKGFNVGADDYMIKPFDLPELEARLHVLSKRPVIESRIHINGLEIDMNNKEATRNGKRIELTQTCWKLLCLLVRKSPAWISRSDIELNLWPEGASDSDPLRSHLYRLRKAIDKPFTEDASLIESKRGLGIRIRRKE